jgi:two-component system, LytTR family, sensor kinase
MPQPRPDLVAIDARGLRLSPWLIPPLGLAVGIASGTFSYFLQWWIQPEIVQSPIGQYFWVVLFNVLAWTAWFAWLPLIIWLAERFRVTRDTFVRPLAVHLAAGLLIAGAHCIVAGLLQFWLFTVSGYFETLDRPGPTATVLVQRIFLYHFEWKLLIYGGIVAMVHAIAFHRELQVRHVRESRLQASLVEARLEALQRQLHPHFLFNTLHAIATLVHKNADAAEAMIVRLGDLLRAVFRSDVQQEVPLWRELELTEQYLDIQRVRFGAALRCTLDVSVAAREALVPVLILQTLVENSIKHGFARKPAGGEICIAARQRHDRLEITVADNGRGVTDEELRSLNEGVGLSNTRARLEHLYPGQHTVRFETPLGGGFAVTLSMPWVVPSERREVAELSVPA